MLNFHRERWNPVKKHSKALVFFAVSKQIPIVYSADRGRAEIREQRVNVHHQRSVNCGDLKTSSVTAWVSKLTIMK